MQTLDADPQFEQMVKSQDVTRQKVDDLANVEDEFDQLFGDDFDDAPEPINHEEVYQEDEPDLPKFGDDLNASFGRNESDPIDEPENAQGQEDRIIPQEVR